MSKHALLILALLVTLLSGWLVLSFVQESQGRTTTSLSSVPDATGEAYTNGISDTQVMQTEVEISGGTKTMVEIK